MGKAAKHPLKSSFVLPELRQVAALPLRMEDGGLEVCLVTTRETRRWTIPKGWPMKDIKDCRAAAIEAEQEAGLLGKTQKEPVGEYFYWKRRNLQFDLVRVFVYQLDVTGHLPAWREMGEREVRWFKPHDAALLVAEVGLSTLLEGLEEAA
ncbi:NUDIX hydrolase [Labrys okinawensis]|uniref:NUDIX hydrolase n=1 Tax=Labrys okinawensis TaxID=346911 RepID=UPI0039BCA5CB